MSIGVLGFVVWSQWLAFLIGDYEVINSTVGWNGFLFLFLFTFTSICFICFICFICYTKLGNLLDTFYSLNANKNAQSAGNLCLTPPLLCCFNVRTSYCNGHFVEKAENLDGTKKGSSETIRGNTYDLFKKNFAFFFKQEFIVPSGQIDSDWLSWFIGFLEGDGAILEHKGRPSFVLTQKDDTVLHEIYHTLKVGKVKQFFDNKGNRKYSRYIVSENKGIFLLYLLLNGNLALEHRVNQLIRWNTALNNASKLDYSLFFTKEVPRLVEALKQPNIKDAWLSGFTDAEGCFSVKIANAKSLHYVSLLFILDQKNDEVVLNKIAFLFSDNKKAIVRTPNKLFRIHSNKSELSKSCNPSKNNMFRLTFYCNDKKKMISSKIIEYFNIYKLKTSKKESFRLWTLILANVLNKQPLSSENLKEVRKLRHNMNYFTLENKSIGFANKS